MGSFETYAGEKKTLFSELLAFACQRASQGRVAQGSRSRPRPPTPGGLGPLEAVGAPVHSLRLQFLISSGATGLEGRGLQCERKDLNEKAGCGGGAPLFPARPGGFCWLWGEVRFWGAFLALDRVFDLEVTGAHNSSPPHFGGCSCAKDSQESFNC